MKPKKEMSQHILTFSATTQASFPKWSAFWFRYPLCEVEEGNIWADSLKGKYNFFQALVEEKGRFRLTNSAHNLDRWKGTAWWGGGGGITAQQLRAHTLLS